MKQPTKKKNQETDTKIKTIWAIFTYSGKQEKSQNCSKTQK
jgi:ferritin-like metal-binding protein YciE